MRPYSLLLTTKYDLSYPISNRNNNGVLESRSILKLILLRNAGETLSSVHCIESFTEFVGNYHHLIRFNVHSKILIENN